MERQNETLEMQADRAVAEALHELAEAPLDDPDDYARQCDFAGCYPWLQEIICVHPHDSPIRAALHNGDAADDQDCYS
jgi:hypothetical protein